MRNPEIALQKTEKLEGKLKTLQVYLNRPGITADHFKSALMEAEEIVQDIKEMISRESNLTSR